MSPELVSGSFAVVGALVGALATYLLSKVTAWKDKKKSHISIRFWSPENLTRSLTASGLQFRISQKGRKIDTVFEGTVQVSNDGQTPVKGLSVLISSTTKAKMFGASSHRQKSNLGTILVTNRVDDVTYKLQIEYLNPAEKVWLNCYFDAPPKELIVDYEVVGPVVELINSGVILERLERREEALLKLANYMLPRLPIVVGLMVLALAIAVLASWKS